MPRKSILADTIEEAVTEIIPYLEDASNNARKAIYFDGWQGLAASAVLREIAKYPPPSLLKKFNKIIHVDCSRWKSRRTLQRTIAQELKLTQRVMGILNRQDEEDDFRGIDEGSRAEISSVGREIFQVLAGHDSLVVFHNGSYDMVNLTDFGIPPLRFCDNKVLWTFRGRLRLNLEISENVDISDLCLYDVFSRHGWNFLLQIEAREIAGCIDKLGEEALDCCLYLLSLNHQGGNIMDYDWAAHASSYWVCDGIIQEGQADEAWEHAATLQQQIHMEDYLSNNALPSFCYQLNTPPKRWVFARGNSVVHPESTSFFLAAYDYASRPLPNDMFHQSYKLRVLKLYRCTFSFSWPPFHCCQSLRFLGLDGCKDQGAEEVDKQDRPEMEFFKCLWVLDMCYTNWELDLSPEIVQQMAANIREVHIKKGRFWHINFAWRQLQNLRKLQVIEPTRPWETGEKDEFINMVKMELLDLSGNSTIQVLPNLSRATSLKALVLDGCVGLEHVEGLPRSLESFSLDVKPEKDDYKEAKIICISMAGCARLSDFKLHGSLPNLEELDLSGTKVKTLDLTTHVVQVPCLQRVMLLGCEQLRAVLWPEEGMPQLSLLCIDTRGGEEVGRITRGSNKLTEGCCQAYVAMMDMRFIQSLVLTSFKGFVWNNNIFSLNICISATGTDGEHSYNMEKMSPGTSRKLVGTPQPKSLIANPSYNTYADVTSDDMTVDHDYNSAVQFQRSGCHVEIGDGIINNTVGSIQGIEAVIFVMGKAESLHVLDNSSITTVIPENMVSIEENELTWHSLKQCHVARCPKMQTVFTTNYTRYCFQEIETFWAADLLMAHCIWSKGRRTYDGWDPFSFGRLRSIHLYSCPRLAFVLALSWNAPGSVFSSLEILHIVNCGDLVKVFPVEPELLEYRSGVLEFPNLKHIYMHELPKLEQICGAKIFAPNLETIKLRGCWSLRRLPAIGPDNGRRPLVDCEKDWWEKMEWDGMEAGHHPSLFKPRHSLHYKKRLPRVSVLR